MLPATTKKQREPMYRDLERLLSPGFLSATVRCGDLSFCVRSLQTTDLDLLRGIAKEAKADWPVWVAAASIWMIDGYSTLESYPNVTRQVYDLLMKSHKSIVRAVFHQSVTFFERIRKANIVFESYLYEDESRRLWKAAKLSPQLVLMGSYPGAERLGTNSIQKVWLDWNQSEDDRIGDDYSWSLTKVLVSVQSSKGAKKLDSKDKARADREKSRRSEAQDKAYYKWLGVLDEKERSPVESSMEVFQPRTADELAEEMRRWLAGEHDFHDRVVEDYKNRVKQEMEEREADQQKAVEEAQARREREEQETGFSRPALVAYTPEQLARLVPEKAKPGAKFIIEANPTSRTYNKYLRDAPDAGSLKVEGGRVVAYTSPTGGEAPNEARPSLNDLIAGRKPTTHG